eukprot:6173329-Pleurochrysis_carterae.AAC.3
MMRSGLDYWCGTSNVVRLADAMSAYYERSTESHPQYASYQSILSVFTSVDGQHPARILAKSRAKPLL